MQKGLVKMGGNATKGFARSVAQGGGGGGGTTNYNDLENKPSINGVTLSGNKTSEDLGISSGGVTITQATVTETSTNNFTIDTEGASALIFVGKTSSGGLNYYATEFYPMSIISNMTEYYDEIVISGNVAISNTAPSNVCFTFRGVTNNVLNIAKYGGNMDLVAVYKI